MQHNSIPLSAISRRFSFLPPASRYTSIPCPCPLCSPTSGSTNPLVRAATPSTPNSCASFNTLLLSTWVTNEECGIVGVSGVPDAAEKVFLGLYALQHRGQETAGICSIDGADATLHKGPGLVAEVFDAESLSRHRPKQLRATPHQASPTATGERCVPG